jgi:uncharacterized BrkB/YihY/UPF0761 family membrane protein
MDAFQQRHAPVAFTFAVIKKFGDDRGGSLAALLAYYGFLAMFPLLLLLTTLLGFILNHNPATLHTVRHSVLAEFPIIGDQLSSNIHPLRASGPAVVIGLLGLLWGSLGVTAIAQHAMAEVWNVPGVDRPGYLIRLRRGLAVLATGGIGLVGATILASFLTFGGGTPLGRVLGAAASLALDVVLSVAVFRLSTRRQVTTRDLVPGALLAGIGGWALQVAGGFLVGHQLRHTQQVYGYFGSVLGLVSLLFLGAQLFVYAAELNVVRARRLWPRSIIQPPLTPADRRTLTALAKQSERRPEQLVSVEFEDEAPAPS